MRPYADTLCGSDSTFRMQKFNCMLQMYGVRQPELIVQLVVHFWEWI